VSKVIGEVVPGKTTRKRIFTRAVLALSAVLFLAGCNATSPKSAPPRSRPTPIATSMLSPNSLCAPDEGDNVHQLLSGDFTGCFRVPDIRSGSIVVALQAYVEGVPTSPTTALTTTTKPAPAVSISLSPGRKTVTPGDRVVLTGHLNKVISPRDTFANLCWGGCGGLVEQGVQVRWLSPRIFQMTLLVPQTAWLDARDGGVSVHALTSGSYEVGVQCLTSISGCALRPAEAKTLIKLRAPNPRRCVRGRQCETMTVGPSSAHVGDEVMVSGWAPVQDLVGPGFGYSISVTPGSARTTYPRLAYSASKLAGSFNVVLTPTRVRIGPSPPWAKLGRISYLTSTYSGPSPVDAVPNSSRVAWCEPSGIVITGDSTQETISTAGVASALRGSTLHFFPASTSAAPACTTVQLDPNFLDTVYAGFGAGEGASIPPIYLAPMYTTDAGATWHTVPLPREFALEDFGGFAIDGQEVAALFSRDNFSNGEFPQSTRDGYATAEVTTNGGASWHTSTLGCPAIGPCVTFGQYEWGNCNMTEDLQPLLVGPTGTSAASGVKWRYSTWVTTVNSCSTQQLAAVSSKELFLVDPSSEYPLLRSTDAGLNWTNWELPPIPAENYGPDSAPLTNSMVLAPDGSMFASISTPAGDRQELYRLYPAATSWCRVPDVFGENSPDLISSLRVDATDLLWNQSSPAAMHRVAFSRLTCVP
jgi:hypothetical protein